MAWIRVVLMSFAVWLATGAASAQDRGPHVRIELIAETGRPSPGSEVALALASTPAPGWHAYWENPGDAGLPARAAWTLPIGATAGPLRYPVPRRLTIAGLMNYVYEAPFAPLVTIRIPAEAKVGDALPVRVKLEYLVCTDQICVPEKAELATILTIGDGAISADRRARFDAWRAALPKPLGSQALYQRDDRVLRLGIPFPAAASLAGEGYFYPLTQNAVDYAAPQRVIREGDRVVVEATAKNPAGAISGVLAFGNQGFIVQAVPGAVAPAAASGGWLGATLLAFLGAVTGGLILNIMPCVFPILSLKALSLAKANDKDANPRGEALAYTAGVIAVCLALGGILLAIRAAGATVGWAFQLQDPRIILILLLLMSGIALNLAGLFEINAPGFVNRAAARGHGGAFATGALAAFVATPCSGPFMASALGAALILPWPAALAIFAGLGLGIALPFLLLGFIPALRRRLPRPGAWMIRLRWVLSIPMFLTALALLWVLWRQAGDLGLILGIGATLLVALGLWTVGKRQRKGATFVWLLALPALILALGPAFFVRPVTLEQKFAHGERFSEARLAALRAQGRPVFAYFTADWCLTCKVNEKAVIETGPVVDALAKGKVAVLVGDWTNGDPELGRFIERHNRAGVPLYLWYAPGSVEPEILPQILSQSLLAGHAAAR